MWLACELWRSFQVVTRWSLCVASAADRYAELCPYRASHSLRHVGQRCPGLQRWVLCVLARSCVRAADMHDLCLWFCRASWRSLGIARWSLRLLLTAALELCPFTHHCAISARDVRGFSIFFVGYFVFGFALASGLQIRTTRACGSGVRAVARLPGRNTLVTSGGERC